MSTKLSTVLILKGLPGSGKSTFAKEWVLNEPENRIRVNKDDLRTSINIGFHGKGTETLILAIEEECIKQAIALGKDVIIDSTNLRPFHERRIRKLVQGKADVEVKFFDVPLKTCLEWNNTRVGLASYVPPEAIKQMSHQWETQWKKIDCSIPERTQAAPASYEWQEGLPWAIISDLDGTLANNTGGRGFYDYDRVKEDEVHGVIADLVRRMHTTHKVIIVSGRDDDCLEISTQWLTDSKIPFDAIYFRKTGDKRKDSIVKREIFENEIAGKYNVEFVLDDRTQTVDAWRELGLVCLQVAPGDF